MADEHSQTILKVCVECGKKDSHYKCPTCLKRYCSVACCGTHKTKGCEKPPDERSKNNDELTQVSYLYPTEDTVDVDKLKLLGGSVELKTILKDPILRRMLVEIDCEPKPERLLKECMKDEGFATFVDTVLKIVEPESAAES